jgi:hypothetical protein
MMAAALLHWSITHSYSCPYFMLAPSCQVAFASFVCSFKWALEKALIFFFFNLQPWFWKNRLFSYCNWNGLIIAKAKIFWLQLKAGEIVYTLSFYDKYRFSLCRSKKIRSTHYILLLQTGLKMFKQISMIES